MDITKILDVFYRSQTVSEFDPFTANNLACLAMALSTNGIGGAIPSPRLEVEIYERSLEYGWNIFSPQGLKRICESYDVPDDLTMNGSLEDIRNAIDNDQVVIIPGFFRELGHSVIIHAYGSHGFFVNDPYGELVTNVEHFPWYYRFNYDGRRYGEHCLYDHKLIAATCGSWCYSQARAVHPNISLFEANAVRNLVLHRIG
ncbi:MAG: hypothetical protein F6K40_26245 [Okeania sp. SIO3I5]|uniref:hypothetical protein n=1 Tax=Okeania sp. SIO3I5 TaxID=2607805 RepID=UPI0013BB72F4|nr:hypothetical protein [Okeania sp. SIO3I5]NEQ39566.1 hypothetical protein [Okeania sp. SIO3I5]